MTRIILGLLYTALFLWIVGAIMGLLWALVLHAASLALILALGFLLAGYFRQGSQPDNADRMKDIN